MTLGAEDARIVFEERMIENPLTTDGLVEAALERGEQQPAWVPVAVNLVLMIGGLARVKGLTDVQKAAAGRYRSLFERAQIGGARATDYSAAKVDVSGGTYDPGLDGAAARREYLYARKALGPFQASLLERVVCEEATVRQMATQLGEGSGGSARRRTTRRLTDAVDVLVDHFSHGRRRVRGGGMIASDWSTTAGGADDETTA